jgi:hypothetical protein
MTPAMTTPAMASSEACSRESYGKENYSQSSYQPNRPAFHRYTSQKTMLSTALRKVGCDKDWFRNVKVGKDCAQCTRRGYSLEEAFEPL